MRFRPCIDIHNGQVKQIVGSTLKDEGNEAKENFISTKGAGYYATLYKERNLPGGHIILLNHKDSEFFEATRNQAMEALKAFPNGMMIGGGVTDENANEYIEAGASHVIVTSFVFKNGEFNEKNLEKLINAVGKDHICLDLSCKKKNNDYYIVTDRWQNFTNVRIDKKTLEDLSQSCDEFLIHAADVEGKKKGIDEELASILGEVENFPITYAGGIGNLSDIEKLKIAGNNRLDYTIGSALDLFGGELPFEKIADMKI